MSLNFCRNCGCPEEEHGGGAEGELCTGCEEECWFEPEDDEETEEDREVDEDAEDDE